MRAEELYEKSIAVLQEAGALPHAVHMTLVALGHVAVDRQDMKRAGMRFAEALNSSAALGHHLALGAAMEGIGLLLLKNTAARRELLNLAFQVLGAAASLQQGSPATGAGQAAQAVLEHMRQEIGRRQVDELLMEGRRLPLEEAMTVARTAAHLICAFSASTPVVRF